MEGSDLIAPLLQQSSFSNEDEKKPSLKSLLTASAFTINFIFGAGILGIPIAFVSGGILAGVVTLFCVTIFSAASMIWEVECIARAEALMDDDRQRRASREEGAQSVEEEEEGEGGAAGAAHPSAAAAAAAAAPRLRYRLTPGRLSIPALCRYLLGPRWQAAYEACLWVNTVATMWLYAVIFRCYYTHVLLSMQFICGASMRLLCVGLVQEVQALPM